MRWNDWRLVALLAGVILAVIWLLMPEAGGQAIAGGCRMPPRHVSDITCRLPPPGCGDGQICFDSKVALEVIVKISIALAVTFGIGNGLLWIGGRCSGPILEKIISIFEMLSTITKEIGAARKELGGVTCAADKTASNLHDFEVSTQVALAEIKGNLSGLACCRPCPGPVSKSGCDDSRVERLEKRVNTLEDRLDHRFDRLDIRFDEIKEMIRSKKE